MVVVEAAEVTNNSMMIAMMDHMEVVYHEVMLNNPRTMVLNTKAMEIL
jgi:hypothetical protein